MKIPMPGLPGFIDVPDMPGGVRIIPSKYSDESMSLEEWEKHMTAGDLCVHCYELPEKHVNGQCLFDGTTYTRSSKP